MTIVAAWRSRTGRERRAFVEAFAGLLAASLAVRFLPFHRLAASAGRPVRTASPPDPAATVALVAWAVAAAARRARFRAVCIERGLTAQAMLRRRGIAVTLHYGIARRAGNLTAHVWVTWGGEDVVGGAESADFREMATFGDPPSISERSAK